MSDHNSDKHFVYVYIDPRNYQEFYFGEGRGKRHLSHLKDKTPCDRTRIISEIRAEGLQPIIRIIAKDLTKSEARLVEKTLLWRLGKNLSNISTGYFAKRFRPENTLHKSIFGFDYQNSVYYMNVGEGDGDTRCWEDCRKYGFMAAGQDWTKWGSKLQVFNEGDIVCAYAAGHGYVGIGRVEAASMMASEFKVKGKTLSAFKLKQPNIYRKNAGTKNGDYLIGVKWIKSISKEDATKVSRNAFTNSMVVASLENQSKTLTYLEKQFGVSFERLIARG
jgi:uncharacterized protein